MNAAERIRGLRWADAAAIGVGLLCSSLVMFWGLPVPQAWLFNLEAFAFWFMVAVAFLMACLPLLRRFPSALPMVDLLPAGPSVLRPRRGTLSLEVMGLIAAFLVFSLPIVSLWSTGKTTYFHLGGLLPWSDPSGYYFGGRHLLNEGHLDYWNMRRPLNAGFLATRLALVNQDFQLSLILQVWLVALTCFLAARVVAWSHGAASGLLVFALLYEFVRPYLGTTLSECLGLSFGCLGFVVLWSACRQACPGPLIAAGVLFLTLGLNARAGAFFVLPALLLWVLLAFPGNGLLAWRSAGWGAAGLCAGFLLNALLLWTLGTDQNMAHSNFSLTLYGLAVGSKGWSQIYIDHPEIRAMGSERVASQYIYELAMNEILTEPARFISVYLDGLQYSWRHAFQFIEEINSYGHGSDFTDTMLIPAFKALSFIFVIAFLVRAKDRCSRQLLVAMVGIFASAPLLRDGGYRVFAATFPYFVAVPAVGLSFLASILGTRDAAAGVSAPPAETAPYTPRVAVVVGVIVAFSSVLGPLLAGILSDRPKFDQAVCESGLHPVIFRLGSGSAFLRILPEGSSARTHAPDIRFEDFKADPRFGGNEILSILRKVRPGMWIVNGYDLRPDLQEYERLVWLIADEGVDIPPLGEYVQACGRQDARAAGFRVIHVQSARVVEPRR